MEKTGGGGLPSSLSVSSSLSTAFLSDGSSSLSRDVSSLQSLSSVSTPPTSSKSLWGAGADDGLVSSSPRSPRSPHTPTMLPIMTVMTPTPAPDDDDDEEEEGDEEEREDAEEGNNNEEEEDDAREELESQTTTHLGYGSEAALSTSPSLSVASTGRIGGGREGSSRHQDRHQHHDDDDGGGEEEEEKREGNAGKRQGGAMLHTRSRSDFSLSELSGSSLSTVLQSSPRMPSKGSFFRGALVPGRRSKSELSVAMQQNQQQQQQQQQQEAELPDTPLSAGVDSAATTPSRPTARRRSISMLFHKEQRSSSSPGPTPTQPQPPPEKHRRPSSLTTPVKETSVVDKSYDAEGRKMINQYVLLDLLGKGMHGRVKECIDSETQIHYAMKSVRKNHERRFGAKATNPMKKIKVEIAILKKCDHPNVVKLVEVIDMAEASKIYLVFELMQGRAIKWHTEENEPVLSVDKSRSYFRDVLLGLEYLHYQGIVHRDIKPENLLVDVNDRVKISDFGVSHQAEDEDVNDIDLAKTVGTPVFFAPELCGGFDEGAKPVGKAIDVWALGVTLYCFVFGKLPFFAETSYELFELIRTKECDFEDQRVPISDDLNNLLSGMLRKDPTQRFSVNQIKEHPWVLKGIQYPEKWLTETNPKKQAAIHVTLDEVKNAVTLLSKFKKRFHKISTTISSTWRKTRSPLHSPTSPNFPETSVTKMKKKTLDEEDKPTTPSSLASFNSNTESPFEEPHHHRHPHHALQSTSYLSLHDSYPTNNSSTSSSISLELKKRSVSMTESLRSGFSDSDSPVGASPSSAPASSNVRNNRLKASRSQEIFLNDVPPQLEETESEV